MDLAETRTHMPYADVDPDSLSAEQILAQMEAAEKAPEPGMTRVNEIIHRGDDDVPVQMAVRALRSAGYTYVYHVETGERSVVNRNMLPAQLKKVLPGDERGRFAFTMMKPKNPPKRGTIKCLLHADHERRAEFDAMGLPGCRKATITSEFQLESHMKSKHPSSWKAIEAKREKLEKEEDRRLQRAFMQSVAATQATGKKSA